MDRRLLVEQEIEKGKHIKDLKAKEELTEQEEDELREWSNEAMETQYTIVGGF